MTLPLETTCPSVEELPDNYLIALTNCSAISLTGEEQSSYLQGQVTCDVNSLEQSLLLHGAHCNAKGKVFSCFRLFNRNNTHLLFQPKSTIDSSINELKKFGVFAKVDITECENLAFFALVGAQAVEILKSKFGQTPDGLSPVVQYESTTIVYISGATDRYLLIDEIAKIDELVGSFKLPIFSQPVWNLLEILEGIPCLTEKTNGEFVPQMLNMQAIKGISFTKGCYLGQETVARMQYLGKNKKALFALSGSLSNKITQLTIEKQLGDNWRKAGDIIAVYQSDNGNCTVQAVLANDIDASTKLRLKGEESGELVLCPLPYSLDQE